MKKFTMIVGSILIGAIFIYILWIIFGSLYIGGVFNLPVNKGMLEKEFQDNQNEFFVVQNFLTTQKSDIHITKDNINVISDKEVKNALNTLIDYGYSSIRKSENTIIFIRWTNLDNGRGIVYSTDGEEPNLQFLTKLEPLSKVNWYYYEEDFNKWRLQN